jgi:glycerol-3-phosphate O-acyltransferase
MDYVILTLLFYEKGLLPPHVAAGINLAFWPFGAIARWCGGFFIRRSFKGDHLYSAVVRAYVKRLMRDGFPQEFFIEGGRSRTGKLAFPKTGLLAMEVDAWREGAGEDLFFVPVAIDYEKLPEGGSYARELGGGEKKKENVWSLLEARKILRTRHGRIYVQFDRPISLAELTGGRDQPLVVGDRQGDAGRRAFVQSLANRIAYGINRASTITPVGLCAAALLSGTEPITGAELTWRLGLLRRIAVEGGGRLPAVLAGAELDPAAGGPIGEALAMLRRDGVVEARGAGERTTYGVPRARRAELDFFRNNVIHHFVAMAIIAAARGARPPSIWEPSEGSQTLPRWAPAGDPPTPHAPDRADAHAPANPAAARTLEADTRWLSRLFKLEFMYRVGARFETIFAETRQAMAKLEIDGAPGAGPSRAESFLSQMVVPYADAYRVAALTLTTWPGGDRRAFVRSALQRAGEEVAAGRIEPEAASKTTLENAAAWLMGEGALESPGGEDASDGGGRLRVSTAWRESRARALVSDIDRFRPLPPRAPS